MADLAPHMVQALLTAPAICQVIATDLETTPAAGGLLPLLPGPRLLPRLMVPEARTGAAPRAAATTTAFSVCIGSFPLTKKLLTNGIECMASYGGLNTATYTPTATNTASYGGGATITVTVAPTQGVLRYVPFVVNASVGDTIKFMWGANNHTVTKSSELTVCNKTLDNPFSSGEQNKGFVCKSKIFASHICHHILIYVTTKSPRLLMTRTPPSSTAAPPPIARRECSVSCTSTYCYSLRIF